MIGLSDTTQEKALELARTLCESIRRKPFRLPDAPCPNSGYDQYWSDRNQTGRTVTAASTCSPGKADQIRRHSALCRENRRA